MKTSVLFLSILAAAATGVVNAQRVSAQQETGARYKFAPTVYKIEQPRIPSNVEGPHAVTQGAMPHSSNFLGVDPGMLTPPPRPQVVAKPVPATQVSHKLFVPNTAFKPDFGKPVQPLQAGEPVKMQTLPPGAGSPISQKAAPPTALKAAAPVQQPKHSAPRHNHQIAVHGNLKTPTHSHGESATPMAASYSQGYVPGGLLPAQSGVGMKTRADVSGKVIPKH